MFLFATVTNPRGHSNDNITNHDHRIVSPGPGVTVPEDTRDREVVQKNNDRRGSRSYYVSIYVYCSATCVKYTSVITSKSCGKSVALGGWYGREEKSKPRALRPNNERRRVRREATAKKHARATNGVTGVRCTAVNYVEHRVVFFEIRSSAVRDRPRRIRTKTRRSAFSTQIDRPKRFRDLGRIDRDTNIPFDR